MATIMPDRAAFQRWAEMQPRGRFERMAGEVVPVSPERWEHARLKAEIWRALDAALSGHPTCRVVPDGMTVAVDDDTDFEPDVAIHCGAPIPRASLLIPNPVVVIEVLSPSTKRIDTSVKVDKYLKVAEHYLIFRADRADVVHWRRGAASPTRPSGRVTLDPPGITVDLAAIYRRAEDA
jgi:Uma2 family endonuclease